MLGLSVLRWFGGKTILNKQMVLCGKKCKCSLIFREGCFFIIGYQVFLLSNNGSHYFFPIPRQLCCHCDGFHQKIQCKIVQDMFLRIVKYPHYHNWTCVEKNHALFFFFRSNQKNLGFIHSDRFEKHSVCKSSIFDYSNFCNHL